MWRYGMLDVLDYGMAHDVECGDAKCDGAMCGRLRGEMSVAWWEVLCGDVTSDVVWNVMWSVECGSVVLQNVLV